MQVGGPFVRWPRSGLPPVALGCVAARARDMGPRELGLPGTFDGESSVPDASGAWESLLRVPI